METNIYQQTKASENFEFRAQKDLEMIAQDDLEVQNIKGTLYAFGSELATLRLFKHYNQVTRNNRTYQGYSENLKRYYFTIQEMF